MRGKDKRPSWDYQPLQKASDRYMLVIPSLGTNWQEALNTIYIKGHYGSGQLYLWGKGRKWQELPVPQEITTAMPVVDGETEQCWHYLARAFVKDIGGEAVERYPTFKEGSRCRRLIDLIRRNDNRTDVSDLA